MGGTRIPLTAIQGLLRQIAAIRREKGISLAEVLVALAIVATAVVMFLSTLLTGSKTVGLIYERTTAENLARSQLEYTKSQDYIPAPSSYDTIMSLPSGFTVSAQASAIAGRDDDIQKITVTVYRGGKSILLIGDFKVNR